MTRAILMLAALGFAGCGGSDTTTAPPAAEQPAPTIATPMLRDGPEIGCSQPTSMVALICSGRVYMKCIWRQDGHEAVRAFWSTTSGGWEEHDPNDYPPDCPKAI